MCLFCGSVDDHFSAALKGDKSKLVPRIGNVDFIAAGSPCPGFSALQQHFLSEQSLRNASHISTFCSYVDLYRPLYGVLENVVNMASTRVGYEDQNVLSQVVACLVSMGYQCNQYIMDAWSYGSAQQRSRLILAIAAPGLEPIAQPWHTHARPYEDTSGKCLGRLPNGERFGEREHYPTPFAYISAATVGDGLPDIGTGIVQTCIPFPDHRVPGLPTHKKRALVKCIPRQPPGCGYKEAAQRGLVPTLLKDPRQDIGKAYRRIKANGLVPCITTGCSIRDSRNGAVLHWDQHRTISVLEARRTQGYMDEEPIIGNIVEQYKIVGNGVDRKVAFAMGLALLQAVQKNELGFTANGTVQNAAEVVDFVSDTTSYSGQHDDSKFKSKFISRELRPVSKEQPAQTTRPAVMITRRLRTVENTGDNISDSVTSKTGAKVADGATNESTQTSRSLQFRGSDQQKHGFFSRTSQTLTAGVSRLSLLNIASSRPASRPATIATPTKRSRDNDVDDITTESESDLPRERPRKQLRVSETPTVDSMTSEEVGNDRRKSVFSHRHSRGSSTSSSTKTRQTRHSGLSVEFVPKNWNKRPEVEVRECSSQMS
jgi:DNA (cytosine-5)-methyltransferase 1